MVGRDAVDILDRRERVDDDALGQVGRQRHLDQHAGHLALAIQVEQRLAQRLLVDVVGQLDRAVANPTSSQVLAMRRL